MRVITFAAALIAVYIWKRGRGNDAAGWPSHVSLVALALACLLVLWAEQVVSGWATFWHRDIFEWLPLGACAAGGVLGYILADQQIAYMPANDGSSALDRFSLRAKCLTANLALAALVLVAVVPPRTWGEVFARVQGVKAGVVELTLAAAQGASLTRDIRNAAPPRPVDASHGSGITERTGFIPVRLGIMQSYTYPPRLAPSSGQAGVFETPDSYILSSPGDPSPTDPLRVVRQVQRDRAMAWKTETMRTHLADGTPVPLQESPTTPPLWMKGLGGTQEEFLSRVAPHIECLSEFVKQTKNRRLLEYQNYHIVENLFAIAHLWSAAEKYFALDQTGVADAPAAELQANLASLDPSRGGAAAQRPGFQDVPKNSSINAALSTRMMLLAQQFREFGEWADKFLSVWNARPDMTSANATATREASAARCSNQEAPALSLQRFASELSSKNDADLRSGWFSPYVTVFVAQTLSAMGDHASAIELLVQWISDLDDIEDHAREAGSTHHQFIADWYRLQALDAVLTLQRLSEGSDISIPQTTGGLRSMVQQYFPRVLRSMGETAGISIWRGSSTIACTKAENRWKQPIVLSYATWIKQYLDVVTHGASRPEDLSAEDLDFADILSRLSRSVLRMVASGYRWRLLGDGHGGSVFFGCDG